MFLLLKPLWHLSSEEMEKTRRKIVDDLKNDGIAIIPYGYEIVDCDKEKSESPLF